MAKSEIVRLWPWLSASEFTDALQRWSVIIVMGQSAPGGAEAARMPTDVSQSYDRALATFNRRVDKVRRGDGRGFGFIYFYLAAGLHDLEIC